MNMPRKVYSLTQQLFDRTLKDISFFKNLTWRIIQMSCKQGIIFIAFLLCAKFLSNYEFGIYSYALATVSLLILFCDFGISSSVAKFVAEYRIKDEKKIQFIPFNASLALAILFIIVTVCTFFLGHRVFKNIDAFLPYILPLLFLVPLTSIYDGICRGLNKFKRLGILTAIAACVSLPAIFIFTLKLGLRGAFLGYCFFYFVYLVLLVLKSDTEHRFNFDKHILSEISLYAFYIGTASLGYFLFSRVDILILGYFGYINQIATYELLNKLFIVFLVPFQIIAQVVGPKFTALYATAQYELIFSYLKKYMLFFACIAACFFVAIQVSAPVLVRFFFRDYNNDILPIILFPTVLIFANSVYNTVINTGIIVPIGYARLMTFLNFFLALANLFLCLLLLNVWGYVGVIYATLILNILGTVVLHGIFYRKLRQISHVT
jgi:O-antigen/teichoic acid export membrane protein